MQEQNHSLNMLQMALFSQQQIQYVQEEQKNIQSLLDQLTQNKLIQQQQNILNFPQFAKQQQQIQINNLFALPSQMTSENQQILNKMKQISDNNLDSNTTLLNNNQFQQFEQDSSSETENKSSFSTKLNIKEEYTQESTSLIFSNKKILNNNKDYTKVEYSDDSNQVQNKKIRSKLAQKKRENIVKNSKQQTVYQCEQCDYSSTYLQNYKRHFIKTHPQTEFSCQQCHLKFNSKKDLITHQQEQNHIDNTNDNKEQIYQCLECDFSTKYEKLLNRHTRANHSKVELKCPFENCNFVTNIQRYMKQHKQYCHSTTMLTCEKCDFQTINPQSMYQHKRHQHNNQTFYCDLCNFKTTNEKNINIHKKHMHSNTVFNCNFCDFETKNRDYLKRHIKNMHPAELEQQSQFLQSSSNLLEQ